MRSRGRGVARGQRRTGRTLGHARRRTRPLALRQLEPVGRGTRAAGHFATFLLRRREGPLPGRRRRLQRLLGAAIKSLLGLDLAERLIADAGAMESRLARQVLGDDAREEIARGSTHKSKIATVSVPRFARRRPRSPPRSTAQSRRSAGRTPLCRPRRRLLERTRGTAGTAGRSQESSENHRG